MLGLEKKTFRVSVPEWGWDPECYEAFSHEDALRTWYTNKEVEDSFGTKYPQELTVIVELDTIIRKFVVDTIYEPEMYFEELIDEQEAREGESVPHEVARGPGPDPKADQGQEGQD